MRKGRGIFFRTDLKVNDADHMLFANCHLLSQQQDGKGSCTVPFERIKDKEVVLKSCYKLNNKGRKGSVMTGLPKELRERRNEPQDLRKDGNIVRTAEREKRILFEQKRKGGKWTETERIVVLKCRVSKIKLTLIGLFHEQFTDQFQYLTNH